MAATEDPSLLEFPCAFPIKVMGRADGEFEAAVLTIVHRHVPDLGEAGVKSRPSRKGNYVALTVTILAQSQRQLDDLYQELSAHELVIMVL